jgi:hypothetical protein
VGFLLEFGSFEGGLERLLFVGGLGIEVFCEGLCGVVLFCCCMTGGTVALTTEEINGKLATTARGLDSSDAHF